ncbi:MAG: DNA polymerase Y family protein [Wenzhouxiangella sp.]|nr:DNA polymerase Y family protein [Wenzhouxiangella sp.]TVR95780.1 MAG: DNA polymerase Y family protein [Wenzhouxiangellaceae bacterium]
MSQRPAALWAGLCCPDLPLAAVWAMLPEQGPVAVHDNHQGQARILQASELARRHGVKPGQRLAQALAVLPQLQTRPRRRSAETDTLRQIALTAYQHSHQVVLAPPDTVLLEVGGSRRLHGGLGPLLHVLRDALADQGFAARIGLAPVPAAARLLARLDHRLSSRQALCDYLAGLSISALELAAEQIQALSGCGLRRIGELLTIPAAERARRFGRALNDYLDEIHGRRDTPLVAWQPPERFELRLELPVATADSSALLFVARRALDQLGQWLTIRDQALTRLRLRLEREDNGAPIGFDIALARPGFDLDRLLELATLKLESLVLPAPVAALAVRADSTTEHRPPQADLFSGHNQGDAWPALLDRLSARLGADGLAGLAPAADHRPEKAWRWVAPGTTEPCHERRPRPAWLLDHPRPCRREEVRLEEGPERIEAGWWDGQDCRRDYWIARDRSGRRLWIFHEYKPREGWFIHGMFG